MEHHLTQTQIGVSTGEVFCGICGPATRSDYIVMGSEVNMAARLMSKANPGTILVSKKVYKATSLVTSYEPRLKFQVKGKEGFISAYAPYDITSTTKTNDLTGAEYSTGREEEGEGIVFRLVTSATHILLTFLLPQWRMPSQCSSASQPRTSQRGALLSYRGTLGPGKHSFRARFAKLQSQMPTIFPQYSLRLQNLKAKFRTLPFATSFLSCFASLQTSHRYPRSILSLPN